ncbi:hypothetical protein VTK73DRAFT_6461 [Phialemonium thermophilum]|uniref:Major facilitator superfamily (MFS) profile domain-containing protein n=1 Tax=Phialemonium thermophilum TaxID=223376 RepID=A0ABR3WJB8_9PEZI
MPLTTSADGGSQGAARYYGPPQAPERRSYVRGPQLRASRCSRVAPVRGLSQRGERFRRRDNYWKQREQWLQVDRGSRRGDRSLGTSPLTSVASPAWAVNRPFYGLGAQTRSSPWDTRAPPAGRCRGHPRKAEGIAKNTSVAVAAGATYNVFVLIAGQLVPRMVQMVAWNWGAKSGFFYGGLMALWLVWAYFRLPETKDRTFAEIDISFKNKVKARKFRTTMVDLATQTVGDE